MAGRQLSRRRTAPVDVEQDYVADEESEDLDEPVQDAPRRGRRSASKPAEEETHTRTRRPASGRSSSRTEPPATRTVSHGWDGAKANKEKRFVSDEFKVAEDTTYLIHFLEPEPFATPMEHFVKALLPKRASFYCLEEDCPLDAVGDRPSDRAFFNIAVFDDNGNAVNKWWKATPSIIDIIWDLAHNDRTKPIDRTDIYFEVSKKKGKNGFPQYSVDPLKARDLKDEGFDPYTEAELDELRENLFTADDEDVLKLSTRRELHDVVDSLDD